MKQVETGPHAVRQTAAAADSLKEQAQDLAAAVAQFKLPS